jgi:hypothetical protein
VTRALLAVALLASLAPEAHAQVTRKELDALRAHLELPAATALGPAQVVALPRARPLRVRLAFGLDLRARENVAGWIAEWNRKDGGRLGTIEVVAEGPADVVLARYTDREKVRTRSTTSPDLSPSGPGRTRTSRTRVELEVVPVWTYVVDSRSADRWNVVWRQTGFTTLAETGGSGRESWEGLRDLLKQRGRTRD